VGDGIKVFAGIKLRGPGFIRAIGMEWFVRFLSNPFKYWKRYIWGNPLFLYRIFRDKMAKL
jgi:N-acetylglucosaminyldiphosphoundecaprenol N-acetyl-beta-D-mannosaminyltransferase